MFLFLYFKYYFKILNLFKVFLVSFITREVIIFLNGGWNPPLVFLKIETYLNFKFFNLSVGK